MNKITSTIIVLLIDQIFARIVYTTPQDLLESLAFPTECNTPTGKTGFCVPAKNCFSLVLLHNSTTIKEWRCGPQNENKKNPKVCCERELIEIDASTTAINNTPMTSTSPLPLSSPMDFVENIQIRNSSTGKNEINGPSCGYQVVTLPSRIVGGQVSSTGEFPWLGRLIRRSDEGEEVFTCTGALITPKVVLTSAHCLIARSIMSIGSLYAVSLGEFETDCSPPRKCSSNVKTVQVSKYFIHPLYTSHSKNHDNDIGLIILHEGVELNSDISTICILEENFEAQRYYIGGWGKTEYEMTSPIKLKVALPPFSWEKCVEKYKSININITSRQICSGGEQNKDSCSGDSGGPLMVNRNERWFVAGLVSFGVGCGREGWPGVYVNIPSFSSWIKEVVSQNV